MTYLLFPILTLVTWIWNTPIILVNRRNQILFFLNFKYKGASYFLNKDILKRYTKIRGEKPKIYKQYLPIFPSSNDVIISWNLGSLCCTFEAISSQFICLKQKFTQNLIACSNSADTSLVILFIDCLRISPINLTFIGYEVIHDFPATVLDVGPLMLE